LLECVNCYCYLLLIRQISNACDQFNEGDAKGMIVHIVASCIG